MGPVDGGVGIVKCRRRFYESEEGRPVRNFEGLLGNSEIRSVKPNTSHRGDQRGLERLEKGLAKDRCSSNSRQVRPKECPKKAKCITQIEKNLFALNGRLHPLSLPALYSLQPHRGRDPCAKSDSI